MRRYLCAALLLFAAPLSAQSTTQDSIIAVAKRLFDGMRAHDSAMIRSTFAPGAMMTRVPRPGQPVTFSSVDGFIAQAGAPGEPWDEQIYDPEVKVDGGLATLWVFYTFSAGSRFSHCGVDAFQMIRTDQGWKISVLADTMRRTDCGVEGKRRV